MHPSLLTALTFDDPLCALGTVNLSATPLVAQAALPFSIIRLIILVGWVYACLYCVQYIQLLKYPYLVTLLLPWSQMITP